MLFPLQGHRGLSGAILLVALLAVALGLALSFAPAKAAAQGLPIFAAAALAASLLDQSVLPDQVARIGSAASIVLTALCVHVPHLRRWAALLLSANAGLWCGVVAALSASSALLALPVALIALPGRWIVSRHYAIVLKVLSGWLVAVALLAAALPLITTPGYEPDHME